jgi:hypothetical protein
MINVQRPFKRLVDKLDYLIKLDYWFFIFLYFLYIFQVNLLYRHI